MYPGCLIRYLRDYVPRHFVSIILNILLSTLLSNSLGALPGISLNISPRISRSHQVIDSDLQLPVEWNLLLLALLSFRRPRFRTLHKDECHDLRDSLQEKSTRRDQGIGTTLHEHAAWDDVFGIDLFFFTVSPICCGSHISEQTFEAYSVKRETNELACLNCEYGQFMVLVGRGT